MNFLDAAGLARFFAGLGQKFAALSHTHGTADIEDGAITTAKLANMAVTTSKLGNKCVANGNLGDMSVQEGKIFPQAVTTTKIRDGAVTEDKLDADLKAKINAGGGGGGATVLYETSSPTEITTDNDPDQNTDPAAECVTLTTSLVDADPEFIVVFASMFTDSGKDRAKLSTCIRRPDDGWQQTSYMYGGQGQLLEYLQNGDGYPRHYMYHISAYHRNDASYVRLIEARGTGYTGASDSPWSDRSPGTPYPMGGLYVYKVVGIS